LVHQGRHEKTSRTKGSAGLISKEQMKTDQPNKKRGGKKRENIPRSSKSKGGKWGDTTFKVLGKGGGGGG